MEGNSDKYTGHFFLQTSKKKNLGKKKARILPTVVSNRRTGEKRGVMRQRSANSIPTANVKRGAREDRVSRKKKKRKKTGTNASKESSAKTGQPPGERNNESLKGNVRSP